MNSLPILKHPSAFLPVAMSLAALATVLIFSHHTEPPLRPMRVPQPTYGNSSWLPRFPS